MTTELRKGGIEILGDIPWGTHFCQFYETKEDLLELLVPYFKAGVEHNEFCLWIVFDPIKVDDAYKALREAVPDFDKYLDKGSIEILFHKDVYLKNGRFNGKSVEETFLQKLQNALASGYDGLRINGNETWLEKDNWKEFMEYESNLNNLVHNRKIIVLCTYPLSRSDGSTLLDVAHAHESVVTKRNGKWEMLEEPEIKQVKAQLKRKSDELELEVAERTRELTKLVQELKNEIAEREKAEAKFSTVVEQSLLGFYIISNGKFSYVNSQFAKIFGYTREELINSYPVEEVIHPDDRKMVNDSFRTHAKGKVKTSHYEAKGLKKDGETINIEVYCSGILKEETVAIMGTLLDITERKKAEDKLRQNENLLTVAENIAQTGSWILNLDSNTVTWSEGLYRIFGITKTEFDYSLESVLSFIHPDDCRFVKGIVEAAIKTHEAYNFYFRLVRPDGIMRIIHARGAVMTDEQGKAVRMYGAAQDVTERKQSEDELRLAYQRLSYHVENTPLAVIEWDRNLNITRWSEQAEKIFGWKASEVLGMNRYDPDLQIVYKEDEGKVAKVDHELMEGLVDRNVSLNRNYTKDGKVIYCEWYNSVLRDEHGKVITVLSLTHDVTERMEAEEKLNESYRQIRSLSEHLQKIREEERTRIAREIHDELGQHLTVMKMDVSWLNKKIGDSNDAVKQKLQDLMQLLNATVLSVRRISHELRPNLLDLGLPVAIESHLKEFEKRSGIKTSFEQPEEEPQLPDSIKAGLFRIFQESITNVARHSSASYVRVDLIKKDDHLLLSIKDNGKGFEIEKVSAMKTLGILGIRERSEMMGGACEIQSSPDKGTLVKIIIPLDQETNKL